MSDAEPVEYHKVMLFTDGACSGNPGPGGWAYILRDVRTKREKECAGSERDTTNNRMELLAVIEGLKALKRPCEVAIYSDSQYVLNGMETWMAGWKRNGWRRGKGSKSEPVKNVELWQELDRQMQRHKLKLNYVRGHSGHPENERCDVLAVEAYQNMR